MTKVAGTRRIRILAIHRYFWPDTPPYASMLRSIAARWATDGHDVEVLSTQPSYKPGAAIPRQNRIECLDGIRVRRLSLFPEKDRPLVRIINLVVFSLAIVREALIRKKFDVIMASTAPPVFIGTAARISSRLTGAKFIYHCMDIHPEIGRISGHFKNPLLFNALQRIDAKNCRDAARVIVLSRDMGNTISSREKSQGTQIEIINNFNLPSFQFERKNNVPHTMQKENGSFRLLFAGNIGRFQGLETTIDAMHLLYNNSAIELVFMGEGTALEKLKKRAGTLLGNRVKFFSHQPISIARAVIRTADVCLVSLTSRIYRYAYPSKTMTYLDEGRPLLVSVEQDSELAKLVLNEKIGLVVVPNSVKSMASAISLLSSNSARQHEMAMRAKIVSQKYFLESVVLNRWSDLIRVISSET